MMEDDLTGLLEGELGQSVLDMQVDENENLSDFDVDLDDEAATSALKAAAKRDKKAPARPNLSELRPRLSQLNIANLAETKERRTESADSGISCEHSPIANGNVSRIPPAELTADTESAAASRGASQEQELSEDDDDSQWESATRRRRRRAASQSDGEESPFMRSADSATSNASVENVFSKLRVGAEPKPEPAPVFAKLGVSTEVQAEHAHQQPFPSPSSRLGYYSSEKIWEIREAVGDVKMDYSRYTDIHEEFLRILTPGAHVPRAPRVKKPWSERRNDPLEQNRKKWNTFTDSHKYKNDCDWKKEWKNEFEARGNTVPGYLRTPSQESVENDSNYESPEDWTAQRQAYRKGAGLETALRVNHENHDENSEWNVNGDAVSTTSESNIVMTAPPGFEGIYAALQGTAPPGLPPPGLLACPPGLVPPGLPSPPGLPARNNHCDRNREERSYRSGNDSQESNYVERRSSQDEDSRSGFGQRDFNAMDRRMEKEERKQSRRSYEREEMEREERERERRRFSDEGSSGAGYPGHSGERRNSNYSVPRSYKDNDDTKFSRPFGDPNSYVNMSRSSNDYEGTKFSRPSGERPNSRPNSFHSPPRSNKDYQDTKFSRPETRSFHHSPPRYNNYDDTKYARVGYSREQREERRSREEQEYPRNSRDSQDERNRFPSSVTARPRLEYESTTERNAPASIHHQRSVEVRSESEQMNESFLSADNRSFHERSPVKPVKVDQRPSTSRTILDAVDEQRSSHRSRTSTAREERASHSSQKERHSQTESSTRNSVAPNVAPVPEVAEPKLSYEDQMKLWKEDALRPLRARMYRNGEPIFPYLTKIYGTEIPKVELRQPSKESTKWIQAEMRGRKLDLVPHIYDPETDTATGVVPYDLKDMYHEGKIRPDTQIAVGIEFKQFWSQEEFLNGPMKGPTKTHEPFNEVLDCMRKENELKIKAFRYRERTRDLKYLIEQYEKAKIRGEAE